MNHWDILGPLTFSLELLSTPCMGSACLWKHSPLAKIIWNDPWKKCVGGRHSVSSRQKPPLHSPGTMTELPVRVLIPVTHPRGSNEATGWRSSSLPVMDLHPFVSNSFFHSSMKWELFNQTQLYKEYYLLLYLLVCHQLFQILQVTSCALGMELTSDNRRQNSNCQVKKLSHHPREWGWAPLLTAEGGRVRRV